MNPPLPAISERLLITLLSLVQFVHVVDFMMVMPLGPDFAHELGFAVTDTGLIGGAYTLAASLVGIFASVFLDQIPRKKALLFCLAGVSLATILATFAWNLHSMIAARLVAGAFGGCMMGIANAFVADYVPPERRGVAMGKLMGAFSIASIIGVPFGLELAHRLSWQAPFWAIGIFGLVVWFVAYAKLPFHRAYVRPSETVMQRIKAIVSMLAIRNVQLSYLAMACSMLAAFLIIPNIASFVQMNRGYPRDELGLLYLTAGLVSFFTTRLSGKIVDGSSATTAITLFTLLFVADVYVGFAWATPLVPVTVTFALFMVAMTGRGVGAQSLSSKVPAPSQRGAYMSIQSSIIQMAGAIGSGVSSVVLTEVDGKLVSMDTLGHTTMLIGILAIPLFWIVEKRINKSHAY